MDENIFSKNKNQKIDKNLDDLKQEFDCENLNYELLLNKKNFDLKYLLVVSEIANFFNQEKNEYYSLIENNYFFINIKYLVIFYEEKPCSCVRIKVYQKTDENINFYNEKTMIHLHFNYILNKIKDVMDKI